MFRSNCILLEDQRVLKIKQLKKQDNTFHLKEIKEFEFRELKEKKAIFMNDTGQKVFYRVQNMGVIYWDYWTGESRRVRIDIPGYSFYSAVCAFTLENHISKLYRRKHEEEHNYAFLRMDSEEDKSIKPRTFMLYDLNEEQIIAKFYKIDTFKKLPKAEKVGTISLKQEDELLLIYEDSQPLEFLDT